jgi:hypothetical protein
MVAFVLSALGCPGPTDPPMPETPVKTGSSRGYLCQAGGRVDAGGACQLSDSCPCGQRCVAGVCAADCSRDEDCGAGRVCDGFGQCITPTEVPLLDDGGVPAGSPVQPLDPSPRGQLDVPETTVLLDLNRPTGEVRLTARGQAIPVINVTAARGALVQCEGNSSPFVASCNLSALAAGATRRLTVRLSNAAELTSSDLTLTTETQSISVLIRFLDLDAGTPPPLEGQYEGTARPTAFGSVARSVASALPTPLAELSLPVSVNIFPETNGRRVVTLTDPLGVLFPDPTTVAELTTATDGSLSLRTVPRPFLGRGTDGGSPDVDVSAQLESVSIDRGRSGLFLNVRTRFAGVLEPASDPYVTWRLALGRVANLGSATPPTLPSAWVVTDPLTRLTPTVAENYVAGDGGTLTPLLTTLRNRNPVPTPAELSQAIMCTQRSDSTARFLAADIQSPFSGDLGCQGSAGLQPLLTFGIVKESTFQLADQLNKCLGDLRTHKAILDQNLMMTPPDVAPCIDGPRVMAALAAAQTIDLARATGSTQSADPLASALAHRLLQQWVRTHVFVAKQAGQIDILNDILTSEVQLSAPFNQFDILSMTGRGFDLFLQPRVALPLNRMLPQVLLSPDYRPLAQPTAVLPLNPRHEQGTSLPVAMGEALQQTLDVYAALYERARYVPRDRVPLETSARDFLRRSLVIFAFASALSDNAQANSSNPPRWLGQWNRQAALYGIGVSGLMKSIDNLRKGENPLGIDDELDLPLYRVGDQVGSFSKFSAVSDYLLGSGSTPNAMATVPARVAAAEAALLDARTAYTQNLQQSFTQALTDADAMRRQAAIRRRFGEQITSLCADSSMNSGTVLDMEGTDPNNCFIKKECRPTTSEVVAQLSPGEAAKRVCLAYKIEELSGRGATLSPIVKDVIDRKRFVRFMRVSTDFFGFLFTTDGRTAAPTGARVLYRPTEPLVPLTAQQEAAIQEQCEAVAAGNEERRPDATGFTVSDAGVATAICRGNDECPSGYYCRLEEFPDRFATEGNCVVRGSDAVRTSCYQGSMGQIAVALRANAIDVEIAKEEASSLMKSYEIQSTKCELARTGALGIADAGAVVNQTISNFAKVKLAMDIATNAAEGVADCFDGFAGAQGLVGGALAAGGCTARVTAVATKSVSDGMQFAMEEAQRAHETAMQSAQAQVDYTVCMQDATLAMVGIDAATKRISRALLEGGAKLVEFENAKGTLTAAIAEGREAVAAEKELTVPGLSIEFWLNEKVEAYDAAFRAARRAAYLGVLAVEYEYQVSTPERGNVLAARKVSELRAVLDRLRNLVGTGTVRGRTPSELRAVVSLRDNLLQLASQANFPAGFHQLTEEQRFQMLLTSPRFAVYDANGLYQGQEIPFEVAPFSRFRGASTGGVALLTGQDCAERVWSVNAALVGQNLIQGESTSTRVSIKKQNRFFSQWCTPAPNASAFQFSATRPSQNLFLDPFRDYSPGSPGASPNPAATIQASAEADAFVSARLQPVLNVTRSGFDDPQYFNGSSRELAGRGLYGSYTLFFPAEVLSTGSGNGLRLDRLSDVLLRFDYVSVAQR